MRFHTHSSGLRARRQAERKILSNVIFTKLTVDTNGITDDELVEPFDALVSSGRHYIHHGALPPTRQSAHRPDTAPSGPRRDHGQPPDHTTGRSQPVEAIALVKRALRSVRGRSSHVKGAYGVASDGAARHP